MPRQSPYVFDLITNLARVHYWPESGFVKVVWLDELAVCPVAKPVRDLIEDAAEMGRLDEWCEDRRREADREALETAASVREHAAREAGLIR
jgi:hypothetical protein